MSYAELILIYERAKPRKNYHYKRNTPTPLMFALDILCERAMRPGAYRGRKTFLSLLEKRADLWYITFDSAQTYLFNDRYSNALAHSLLQNLKKQFDVKVIKRAIEDHLPRNRNKRLKRGPSTYVFNLYPQIRPKPRPRSAKRKTKTIS